MEDQSTQQNSEPHDVSPSSSSWYLRFIHNRILFIAVAVISVLLLGIVSYIGYQSFFGRKMLEIPEGAVYVPDELAVEIEEGYRPTDEDQAKWNALYAQLQELGVEKYEKIFRSDTPDMAGYYLLTFKQGVVVDDVREQVFNLPGIISSEPNYIIGTQANADDNYYSGMWGLANIAADRAWDITRGSNDIIVAVIDTGIDYTHPDFSGRNITKGMDYSTCNSTRNEIVASNGKCTKPKDPDDDPMDVAGHGTHVAGTIGAVSNNSIGVAGINWDVTLLALKVLGDGGISFDKSATPRAIEDAADQGARVINLSLGGKGSCGSSLQAAISYAISKNTVVVVAAGNDNINASNFAPANCNGVITVGALDRNDNRTGYSNYGSTIEIAAPGGAGKTLSTGIMSTYPGRQYTALSGTSMASPHVAGVAALVLSKNPGMSPPEVMDCLINSGDPINTDQPLGGVRLNAYNALSGCQVSNDPPTPSPTPDRGVDVTPVDPSVTSTQDPDPTVEPPQNNQINGFVFFDLNSNDQFDSGEPLAPGTQIQVAGPINTNISTSTGNFLINNLTAGTYRLDFINGGVNWGYIPNITLPPGRSLNFPLPAQAYPTPTDPVVTSPVDPGVTSGVTPTGTSDSLITPTPITIYDCKFITKDSSGKTLRLSYMQCTPKGTFTPR